MRQQVHRENSKNTGQMTIIAVISLVAILMSVTLSELLIGYSEYSQSKFDNTAVQAQELAEAGIDNAIEEYEADQTYTGGSFTSPIGGTDTITLSTSGTNPVVVTVTSTATYQKISRTYGATFDNYPPPAIASDVVFAQNNIYVVGSTLNGEVFTNNDATIDSTNVNGDLYEAGKGNGQKTYFQNGSVLSQYNGSGGDLYAWDPSYITNSTINGNVEYHTSLHVSSSTITGSQTKESNNFIPPIGNPTFNFSQVKSIATTNGTYFSSDASFNTFLSAHGATSGGTTTYTLPSGLYDVDCSGLECILPYIFGFQDLFGNDEIIKGSGVSLVFDNNSFWDLGGMDITSPYAYNGGYIPVIASNGGVNGTLILLGVGSSNVNVTLTGLLYTPGIIDTYGISSSNYTHVTGGTWAGNQINYYNYTDITFDSTYVANTYGFGFSNQYSTATKWTETP
jgi:hypothetical protein